LRDGLTWSDGTPLTSADVVASINAARTNHWAGAGDVAHMTASAEGPKSVVVHTTTLDQSLPSLPVHIVPHGDPSKLSVGSGPFVVSAHEPGVVTMTANDHYYGGRPPLDVVEFRLYQNGQALGDAVHSGAVDAASGIPSDQFDGLNRDENVATIVGNNGAYYALSLDTRATGLTDSRARQALGLYIDRALLVQQYNNGVGRAAVTPTLARSTDWDFDQTESQAVEQNLENAGGQAPGLLKDAGVQRIDLAVAVPANDPNAPKVLNALSSVLQGTPIHVRAATAGTEANARLVQRIPTDDPDTILQAFTCKSDASWWCNNSYDQMYASESVDLDPASRVATVRDMKRVLIAQQPEVPLFHTDILEAYRSDRWGNVIRQPQDLGPGIFTLSPLTFTLVQPTAQLGTNKAKAELVLLGGIAVAAFVVLALVAYFVNKARGSGSLRRATPAASN
jgi:peptide/nickel transport system substrate-binding protein